MDGDGVAFLYVLVILLVLPASALAVLVVLAWHIGQKHWPSRRVKLGLGIWVGALFWDVPFKLVLLGWSCLFLSEAWVDPAIEFADRARHFSEQGCGANCLARLDRGRDAREWRDVSVPAVQRFAEEQGVFVYYRAPAGSAACVADWGDALRAHGVKPSGDGRAGDAQECLAREVLSGRPDFPTLEVEDDGPKHLGIPLVFFWDVHHSRIRNLSTGEDAARFRVYTTTLFWWLPVPISCPWGMAGMSATDVMRGDYP